MSMLASLVLCPLNTLTSIELSSGRSSIWRACLTAALAGQLGLGLAGIFSMMDCYPAALVYYEAGQGFSIVVSYIALLSHTRAWLVQLAGPDLAFDCSAPRSVPKPQGSPWRPRICCSANLASG